MIRDWDAFWYCSSRCPGTPGSMHHDISKCPSAEVRGAYALVCATRGKPAQLDLFGGAA